MHWYQMIDHLMFLGEGKLWFEKEVNIGYFLFSGWGVGYILYLVLDVFL